MSAKEAVREILDRLPDDSTLEEIQYRIYVREKVERGLADVEQGDLIDHDEVERRMSRWLSE